MISFGHMKDTQKTTDLMLWVTYQEMKIVMEHVIKQLWKEASVEMSCFFVFRLFRGLFEAVSCPRANVGSLHVRLLVSTCLNLTRPFRSFPSIQLNWNLLKKKRSIYYYRSSHNCVRLQSFSTLWKHASSHWSRSVWTYLSFHLRPLGQWQLVSYESVNCFLINRARSDKNVIVGVSFLRLILITVMDYWPVLDCTF